MSDEETTTTEELEPSKGEEEEDEDEDLDEDDDDDPEDGEEEDEDDEEEDDDDDDVADFDTEKEFRGYYRQSKEQEDRAEAVAKALAPKDEASANIYRELKSMHGLVADVIAATGHALGDLESRLGDVEDEKESFLNTEDAEQTLTTLQAALKLATDVIAATPEHDKERLSSVKKIKKALLNRIEFVKDAGSIDDEPKRSGKS